MAVLPVSPRHARMLLEVAAWQLGLVGAAAASDVQGTEQSSVAADGAGVFLSCVCALDSLVCDWTVCF